MRIPTQLTFSNLHYLDSVDLLSARARTGFEVYAGEDPRLKRKVAIKLLPAHLSSDPGMRIRFEQEALTISALSHPNICSIFDIGHQKGMDYLVMEYIEGKTLAAAL